MITLIQIQNDPVTAVSAVLCGVIVAQICGYRAKENKRWGITLVAVLMALHAGNVFLQWLCGLLEQYTGPIWLLIHLTTCACLFVTRGNVARLFHLSGGKTQ